MMWKRWLFLSLTLALLSALLACPAWADEYQVYVSGDMISGEQAIDSSDSDVVIYLCKGESIQFTLKKDGNSVENVTWQAQSTPEGLTLDEEVCLTVPESATVTGSFNLTITPSLGDGSSTTLGPFEITIDVIDASHNYNLKFTPEENTKMLSPTEQEALAGTLTLTNSDSTSDTAVSLTDVVNALNGAKWESGLLSEDGNDPPPVIPEFRVVGNSNEIKVYVKSLVKYIASQNQTFNLKNTTAYIIKHNGQQIQGTAGTGDNPVNFRLEIDWPEETTIQWGDDNEHTFKEEGILYFYKGDYYIHADGGSVSEGKMYVGDKKKLTLVHSSSITNEIQNLEEGGYQREVVWSVSQGQDALTVEIAEDGCYLTAKNPTTSGDVGVNAQITYYQDGKEFYSFYAESMRMTVDEATVLHVSSEAITLYPGQQTEFKAWITPSGSGTPELMKDNDSAPFTVTEKESEEGSWIIQAGDDAQPGTYTMTASGRDGKGHEIENIQKTITVSIVLPAPPTPVAPPEIDFTPGGGQPGPGGEPATVELEPGQSVTLEVGVVDNYAAFAAAGVEVVATPVCQPGMTASAVVDQSGRILLNLYAIEPGEHQVWVTLSAEDCQPVTAAYVVLNVPAPQPVEPVEPEIQLQEGTQAYTGLQGVTHLSLSEETVAFTLPDVAGAVWKSSKPKVLSIDSQTGVAQLKKSGSATVTATLPDGTAVKLKVNVHKKDFAQPESIRLQTKVDGKWTDVPEEGIVVVPKKSGQKSVPTRLVGDGGEIIIESIEADEALVTRTGGNPAPVKVRKRSITDGQTTTLVITANGMEFVLPITMDSTAKDVYPDQPAAIQEIEEIQELEEPAGETAAIPQEN